MAMDDAASRFWEKPDAALLLSEATAADWLGISRATFWRRVKDKTFPEPIRIGGATRWRRDELLAALDRASAERDGKAA
jgi:predicted DNA-binding transcriptional regulator AlpA